ncbi:MAG: metallophosphoesterase [Pseudomonadota bacterium]
MRRLIALLIGAIALAACANLTTKDPAAPFHGAIAAPPLPWNSENFDAAPGKFSFAIITDLNGGERPGVFDVAVAELNLLRPEFIISVGDLIDGVGEDEASLTAEWDRFDQRAAKARAPFFHVGGNHDLTGSALRKIWEDRYGPRYYHFVYKDVLFLVLDTEDYSLQRMEEIKVIRDTAIKALAGPHPADASKLEYFNLPERFTGEVGGEQAAYFEKAILDNPSVRWTFLFMHKPVWRRGGENAFLRIEAALKDRPYTLFNGHVHSYSHTLRQDRDYIIMGTTGGGQDAKDASAFDHITLVTIGDGDPSIASLRLDGVLDKTGAIPEGGDAYCFQASRCGEK